MVLQVDWSINSETDWKCSGLDNWPDSLIPEYGKDAVTLTSGDLVDQIGLLRSNYSMPAENGYAHICHGIDDSGNGWLDLENNTIYFKLRFVMRDYDDNKVYSDWTDVFTIGKEVEEEKIIASETFLPEIEKADAWGLIPDCLVGQDLTKRITRGEFAAVCVKLYENLSGEAAVAAPADTFTDTTDPEILKAFQVGITNGKYDGGKRFAPDEGLNRQECATMLTRVYKKVSLPGWTLADDANFQLQFTQPALFKDDADIGGFARNSVYFRAANGVINGYTDGTFHPRNTNTAQEAAGYANATRQHALVFSTRIVEKLG